MSKRALIIVDLQNDLLPDGPMGIRDSHKVIPVINRAQDKFDLILATRDWHPVNHGSFASNHPDRRPGEFIDLYGINHILLPDHCVQDSPGADFPERLETERIKKIFSKGADPKVDSYSAFFDNDRKNSTKLDQYLKRKKVTTLFFAGLATDYCVKFSVLDSIDLGFRTYLIKNGCKGIELRPGDVELAEKEMEAAGARLLRGVDIPG